jgi:predicted component of type VI protein secretion system
MASEKSQKVTTFLVVRDGVKPDWVAIWDTVEITVGRHESQDIPVREAEVSRKHCVFRQKSGVYTLEDLGSALGTRVNGEPIKVHELKSGDVIEVGSFKMQVRADRESDQAGRERPLCLAAQGIRGAGRQDERRERPHDDGDRPQRLDVGPRSPTLSKSAPKARAVSLDGRLETPTHPTSAPTSASAEPRRCAISTPRSPNSTMGSDRLRSRSPQRSRARPHGRRSRPPRRLPCRAATCGCSSCSRSRVRPRRSRRSWRQ